MRHRKKLKIGKGTDQRRKLLKTLASSLILYEKIQTGLRNAKVLKSHVEKLITRAKENTLANRRLLLTKLSPMATKKALEVFGPKFKDRNGGYTRIIKLQHHSSGLSKVLIEFID
jgi:large subunit ribosomal protein L17